LYRKGQENKTTPATLVTIQGERKRGEGKELIGDQAVDHAPSKLTAAQTFQGV
jgi:hypothetical protein